MTRTYRDHDSDGRLVEIVGPWYDQEVTPERIGFGITLGQTERKLTLSFREAQDMRDRLNRVLGSIIDRRKPLEDGDVLEADPARFIPGTIEVLRVMFNEDGEGHADCVVHGGSQPVYVTVKPVDALHGSLTKQGKVIHS